jgi:hypothetical protein
MSVAGQHDDSVVTRQPTSLNLNNTYFSKACDCSYPIFAQITDKVVLGP